MLYLAFRIGQSLCAVDARQIVEILPPLQMGTLPDSAGMAGAVNYRGTLLPVVDLACLATGQATQLRSSRILVVQTPQGVDKRLGVLVEGATRTVRLAAERFANGAAADATWVAADELEDAGRVIQRVDLDSWLPALIKRASANPQVA